MSGHPEKLRAWAEVNLSALERNLKTIRHLLPKKLKFISVVKADAYGHGMEPIVSRLMRASTDAFAVANLDEALRIHRIGDGWPILVLGPLLKKEMPDAIHAKVIPVVSSFEECDQLNKVAAKQNSKVSIHLKVDTGMGRIGAWHEEANLLFEALQKFPHLELKGICTHFSTADSDPQFTEIQRARFQSFLKACQPLPPNIWIHADNSAGTENFHADDILNAIRIGILPFGIQCRPQNYFKTAQFEPVLSFHSRIALIKKLPAGTAVSYGQTHRLNLDTRIGIVSAGYADGIPLALSNRGHLLVRGIPCPILGRVTMDQTLIDLTPCPLADVNDPVTLFGKSHETFQSVESISQQAHSIPWEILCQISHRATRIYKRDSIL